MGQIISNFINNLKKNILILFKFNLKENGL
jgi:hypothetical protein